MKISTERKSHLTSRSLFCTVYWDLENSYLAQSSLKCAFPADAILATSLTGVLTGVAAALELRVPVSEFQPFEVSRSKLWLSLVNEPYRRGVPMGSIVIERAKDGLAAGSGVPIAEGASLAMMRWSGGVESCD